MSKEGAGEGAREGQTGRSPPPRCGSGSRWLQRPGEEEHSAVLPVRGVGSRRCRDPPDSPDAASGRRGGKGP